MLTLNKMIQIGTSGWNYHHWKGVFYPAKIRSAELLPYYAQQLLSVEVNSSFYRLPAATTFQQWHNLTPQDFIFSVKANRYLTHMKKLKAPQQSLARFDDAVEALGNKLGVILFQLPPRWGFNAQRLEAFLKTLRRDRRYAFEFRDQSWLCDRTYELLQHYDCSLCIYELAGFRSPLQVTNNTVYIRLHGPDNAYQGNYSDYSLQTWAERLVSWTQEQRSVYCYFDNDQHGYAVLNALKLCQLTTAL